MIGVVATRTMLQVHQSETCSVAACAEIVGAKWTVLIVHELSEGARRFTQIEHSCAGISPRTLAERLRWLEARGDRRPPQLRGVATPGRVRADREGRGTAAPHRRDAPLRPRLARLRRPRPLTGRACRVSYRGRRSRRICCRASRILKPGTTVPRDPSLRQARLNSGRLAPHPDELDHHRRRGWPCPARSPTRGASGTSGRR